MGVFVRVGGMGVLVRVGKGVRVGGLAVRVRLAMTAKVGTRVRLAKVGVIVTKCLCVSVA